MNPIRTFGTTRSALSDISNAQRTLIGGPSACRPAISSIPSFSSLGRVGICSRPTLAPIAHSAAVAPAFLTDIDAPDAADPHSVSEYAKDIVSFHLSVESDFMPNPDYMSLQKDINHKMRGILLDWIVEICHKFRLHSETFYLCINYLDRYLSTRDVHRRKLQLAGITALLMAAKNEEIYPPQISELLYMTKNAFDKRQLIEMEGDMWTCLKFRLTVPNPMSFLRRWLKACDASSDVSMLAQYYYDKCVLDYSMIKYRPSLLAAACVSLALTVNHCSSKASVLEFHSTHTEATIKSCAEDVIRVLNAPTTLKAIDTKYSAEKYRCSSRVPKPTLDML